jgi:chemotaxis protein methyltransferase CheR
MTDEIEDTLLSRLSELVAERLGLEFPRERWTDLKRAVYAAAQELGRRDVGQYLQDLLASNPTRGEVEILASHLTVGETYFFRDNRSLEILEQHIIGNLTDADPPRRQLRIWSAGCATGEEPYSIAILLSRIIPDLNNRNVSILATDLNTRSLEKASEGIYGEWSFRNTPPWVKSRYFAPTTDRRWAIARAVKALVTFACLNLREDAYPSPLGCTNAMDIIFCRNVLMYFTPEARKRVVDQFHRSLAPGGWLIVSPAEVCHVLFSQFAAVGFDGATLYRKESRRPEHTPSPPTPLPQGGGGRTNQESGTNPECSVESTDNLLTSRSRIQVQTDEATIRDSGLLLPPSRSAGREAGGDGVFSNTECNSTPAVSYAEALGLYGLGRYEDSEAMTVALLSRSQGDEQAMLLLARLYGNQGRLRDALRWCERAIAIDKTNARAHYLYATILQEQGSLEQAVLSIRRALYLDPEFVLGHFLLGNLAARLGRLKESEKHFENTLALLAGHQPEDVLPESEGLTAGRLRELIALERGPRSGVAHAHRRSPRLRAVANIS